MSCIRIEICPSDGLNRLILFNLLIIRQQNLILLRSVFQRFSLYQHFFSKKVKETCKLIVYVCMDAHFYIININFIELISRHFYKNIRIKRLLVNSYKSSLC